MPQVIIINGNIGTGKTTIINGMIEKLKEQGVKFCLIKEPVGKWMEYGMLDKFYSDMGKFGYAFETLVFSSKVLSIREQLENNPDAEVILMERCMRTDVEIFMEGLKPKLTSTELKMYYDWCYMYRDLLPIDLDNAFQIFIKNSPEVCFERMNKRKRAGESGVELSYLQFLDKMYDKFIENTKNKIILESELVGKDYTENGKDKESTINLIWKMARLDSTSPKPLTII